MSKRIFTFILALALLLSVANSFTFESSAASTVKIGHASTSNNNTVAGDASGKEVCTRNWYCESSTPWQYVFRPKSSSVAEKIAKAMEQACSNNNIGYNQNKRTTLFTRAKEKNWNLSSITTKCDTDCSALIAVCVNAAGISVSKDMYTGNQYSILKNTGKFADSLQYLNKALEILMLNPEENKKYIELIIEFTTQLKQLINSNGSN